MKVLCTVAVVALSLMGSMGSVSAQSYGDRDYGYRDRGSRDRDYDDRDGDDRGRGSRGRGGDYGFDEREYLRCNEDVRRAVKRGEMESGAVHYQTFGRRERRQLSC